MQGMPNTPRQRQEPCSLVKGDGEAQSKRIEMTLKADKKAQYGYLLTEEPVISNSK